MASSHSRKPSPRKRATKSARKRTPVRRKPARKSAARKRAGRKTTPPRKHGLLFKFCFWPFLLLARLTRSWHGLFRWPARAIGGAAIVWGLIILLGGGFYYLRSLRHDLSRVAEMPARSIILDRHGKQIGRLHGENRYIVSLDDVSPNFRNALIAREDNRFYQHLGVDPIGVLRAIQQNVKTKGFSQGASTLSMQLARNAYRLPTRGEWWEELDRKFLELAITFRIEAHYSKDEILQHYMNLIFWGGSIHGIEAASRTYLEKPAKELSLSEAAMLAGMIRGPNSFSPFEDPEKAKHVRDMTLDAMLREEFITATEAKTAKSESLHIRPEERRIIHDSYAMDAVRRDLDRILAEKSIKHGGLEIRTTIDKPLQDAAERALDKHLRIFERTGGYRHQTRLQWQNKNAGTRGPPAYLQGAVVIIENRTGAVLAVVGGRNADESKFNRALHARRQIGSVFKPFVYMTAFNKGLLPNSLISDARIKPGEIGGAPRNWSPTNSDGKYYASIRAKDGLIQSRNTSSVRVGEVAGMKDVREVARMAGFSKSIPDNPAAYLGSWEATPWEVASAYTIFPNNGTRYRPYLIQEIRDDDEVPYRCDPIGYRATRTGAATEVSKILEEVVQKGTASTIRSRYDFRRPAGGKTGTTDNYIDAWFVGYTSSITCAVWIGLDKPERTIEDGYGSKLALPVWVETMKTADRLHSYNFGSLRPDAQSATCRVCQSSGKRVTDGCERAGTAYNAQLPRDLVPATNEFCTIHLLRAPVVRESPPIRAVPVRETRPPVRAVPVEENPRRPMRAIPVDE